MADTSSAGRAPAAVAPKRRYGAPRRRKDWRTPRRFAYFGNHRVARSVLECPPSAVLLRPSSAVALLRRMERTGGGPPPLFPEAYQTVPMLTGTAISVRIFKKHEDFGLRWQPAEAKRSEDWSAAATPLFDCGQSFQSGVAPALRDSRRSPKKIGCGYAVRCPFGALVFSRRTTGPGVLENYAVLPTKTHHLHLLFSPYPAPGGLDR